MMSGGIQLPTIVSEVEVKKRARRESRKSIERVLTGLGCGTGALESITADHPGARWLCLYYKGYLLHDRHMHKVR